MLMFKLSYLFRSLFFLLVLSAFSGTLFLTFSVGPIHIFPFRIIIIILWLFILLAYGKVPLKTVFVRKSFLFLLFWLFYAIISMLWAANIVEAVKHIVFLFLNFSLLYFMVLHLRNQRDLIRFFKFWLILFAVLIPIAIWEVMTGNHLPNSGLNNISEGYEAYGLAPTTVFANQNDYATMVAFTIPMIVSVARYGSWGVVSKIMLVALLAVSILLLFLAASRSNYIAVFLSLSFWFFFLTKSVSKVKILAGFLFLLLIVSASLSLEQSDFLSSVWSDFSILLEVADEDAGVSVRNNLLKNAIFFFLLSFGFGVGAGNTEHYMATAPKYYVGEITNVHNWWVENLSNYGILVFVGYLFFYVSIVQALWRYYKSSDQRADKMVSESLLCIMVGFPFSSLSSSSLIAFSPHWLIFGFALAFINYKRIENRSRRLLS